MADVLIVADDLTGANACASGFAQAGMRVVTTGLDRDVESIRDFHGRFDVLVATSESRHSPVADADRAIREAVRAGWPVTLTCARIDTTLRGNVGVSAQAVVEETEALSGERCIGLCLPAFPSAERVTIDGHQLLKGVRLEETELAYDVRSPMTTSDIAEIIAKTSSIGTATVPLNVVTGPEDRLVDFMVDLMRDESTKAIVGDALTSDHIDTLARAGVRAANDVGVRLCGIDPGPGSLAIAHAMGMMEAVKPIPLLAVSGSSTDVTMQQLAQLQQDMDVATIPAILSGNVPDVEKNVEALAHALLANESRIVLWTSVLSRDDVRRLDHDEALEFPKRIGRIVRGALEQADIGGIYTTGGDVTAVVLAELEARGIEVEDQVIPLAVSGTIVGGDWEDLPIVTKGGLIGNRKTAVKCLKHLDDMAIRRSRLVANIETT